MLGIQEHSPNRRIGKEKRRIGKKNGQQGEEDGSEKDDCSEKERRRMEKKTKQIKKKNLAGLMKGIFGIYFCNCTFLCKITIFFSHDSLNHSYAILSDIITNFFKLVTWYILFPKN